MQGSEDLEGFITSFAGSHRYVLDYLIEEVLERQPKSVQAFMLQTAILDRLTGSLVRCCHRSRKRSGHP